MRRLGVYHISISHGWQTLEFSVLLIRQLPGYSVLKLDPIGPIPSAPIKADFWSLVITYDERSLVCLTEHAPVQGIQERSDQWTAFRVAGTMDFSLTGIVAKISKVLAEAHLGIFVVSTFDTDFLLVKTTDANAATEKWRESGIEVVTPVHHTNHLDFIDINYELNDIAVNNREGKSWVSDYPTEGDSMIAKLHLTSGEHENVIEPPNGIFQLRSRSTGMAIGGIGFKGEHVDTNFTAVEIGYGLAPTEQHKGLGTEAIAGIVQIAKMRKITQLCAETDTSNIVSQKALIHNGFTVISRNPEDIWWILDLST